MIQFEQLQLKRKGEQIQCSIHFQPISQLDMGKNIHLGERLICNECNTLNHQVLYLNQTEKYLYQMYQEEYQNINQEQQKFNDAINNLKIEIKKVEKIFEIKFSQMQILLHDIKKQFSGLIDFLLQQALTNQKKLTSALSKTKLCQLIEQIAQSQTIDASILQQTAEFLSNQSVVEGKLELKNKVTIQESTKQQIYNSNNWLSTQLNRIKTILENNTQKKEMQQRRMLSIYDQQQSDPLDYDTYNYKDPIQLYEHQDQIRAVAISNNNQLIASADYSGQIILWDLGSRAIKKKYDLKIRIQDLTFSFDDKFLAAAQYDHPFFIILFNLSNITSYQKLQGHESTVLRIAFTSNSKCLISGGFDQTLRLWQLDQLKCITVQKLSSFVYGVQAFQIYISACCDNGQAYLFDGSDLLKIKQLVQWKASDKCVYGTSFTSDSKMLLTYGEAEIKLWNINQLISQDQQTLPLKVYLADKNSEFWSASIRRKDTILISSDGKIRIWNMESGELIRTMDVPDGYSYLFDYNISVSKDMKYILTGGENKQLKIFELSTRNQ